MYKIKMILLSLKSHWGRYLFEGIMFVVILEILSLEIMNMKAGYDETNFISGYGEDMYMYANVMEYVRKYVDDNKTEKMFIEEMEDISGVRGIGYSIDLSGNYVLNESEDYTITFINDIMAEVSYKGISGKWLSDVANDDENINIVVGYKLGEVYKIGDVLYIYDMESDRQIACEVIGVMEENVGVLSLNISGSEKQLYKEVGAGWDIYTNDKRILDGIHETDYAYPTTNLLVALDNDFDEKLLKSYGNIYSLKYMENINLKYFDYIIHLIFETYGVLLFVVLFGTFSVIYLVLSKGMYATGVYSLLGQTKLNKIKENLLIHIIIYCIAALVAYCIYIKTQKEEMSSMFVGEIWTSWNTIFVILLGMITSAINVITSIFMIQKSPKDIMRASKEMEG